MSQDLLSEEEINKKRRIKAFKKYLGIATDTADILATIASRRPTVLGAVSVGLKLINSYETITEKESSDANFFMESGWKPLDIREFKKFIYTILIYSMKPQIVSDGKDDSNCHMIFDLDHPKQKLFNLNHCQQIVCASHRAPCGIKSGNFRFGVH